MENCPNDYGYVYCNCPFAQPVCPGAWNCSDVIMVTDEVFTYMDTNNDGQINLGDDIEAAHLNEINAYCD
jgi:hypothetical protein